VPRTGRKRSEKPEPLHGLKASAQASPNSPLAPSPSKSETSIDDLVTIARIVRPQGIRGEVIAEIATDFPERFAQLSSVNIRTSAGQLRQALLESYRFHQHRVVFKFQGIDTCDQAEELRGASLQIREEDLVSLPEDSYYDFQLIGCEVTTTTGERLGEVKEVMHTGAAPILVITDQNGTEHLIPLAEEICTKIDVKTKRITVAPPEGLLDL
jgi:16S rRNA processing protein RimM